MLIETSLTLARKVKAEMIWVVNEVGCINMIKMRRVGQAAALVSQRAFVVR